jgi:hypothetical protein
MRSQRHAIQTELGGQVPGSLGVKLGNQTQPSPNTTDLAAVIRGVIEAEEAACKQYNNITRAADLVLVPDTFFPEVVSV